MTYEDGYQDGYQDAIKDASKTAQEGGLRTAQEDRRPVEATVYLYIEPAAENVDWRGALDENLSGLALVEGGPGGFGHVGEITGVDVADVDDGSWGPPRQVQRIETKKDER